MNCKPGDLAVVIWTKDPSLRWLVGKLLLVGSRSTAHESAWRMSPPIFDPADGLEIHMRDSHLRPIRDPGDDAVDETLLRLPAPRQEETV